MTHLTADLRETLEAERRALQDALPKLDLEADGIERALDAYRGANKDTLGLPPSQASAECHRAYRDLQDRYLSARAAACRASERISSISMVLNGLRDLDEDPCETGDGANWATALADIPSDDTQDELLEDLSRFVTGRLIAAAPSWVNSLDGDLIDLNLRASAGYVEAARPGEIDVTAIVSQTLAAIREYGQGANGHGPASGDMR